MIRRFSEILQLPILKKLLSKKPQVTEASGENGGVDGPVQCGEISFGIVDQWLSSDLSTNNLKGIDFSLVNAKLKAYEKMAHPRDFTSNQMGLPLLFPKYDDAGRRQGIPDEDQKICSVATCDVVKGRTHGLDQRTVDLATEVIMYYTKTKMAKSILLIPGAYSVYEAKTLNRKFERPSNRDFAVQTMTIMENILFELYEELEEGEVITNEKIQAKFSQVLTGDTSNFLKHTFTGVLDKIPGRNEHCFQMPKIAADTKSAADVIKTESVDNLVVYRYPDDTEVAEAISKYKWFPQCREHFNKNDSASALMVLDRAFTEDNLDSLAWFWYGYVYCKLLQEYHEGIKYFLTGAKLCTTRRALCIQEAAETFLLKLEDSENATLLFLKAIQIVTPATMDWGNVNPSLNQERAFQYLKIILESVGCIHELSFIASKIKLSTYLNIDHVSDLRNKLRRSPHLEKHDKIRAIIVREFPVLQRRVQFLLGRSDDAMVWRCPETDMPFDNESGEDRAKKLKFFAYKTLEEDLRRLSTNVEYSEEQHLIFSVFLGDMGQLMIPIGEQIDASLHDENDHYKLYRAKAYHVLYAVHIWPNQTLDSLPSAWEAKNGYKFVEGMPMFLESAKENGCDHYMHFFITYNKIGCQACTIFIPPPHLLGLYRPVMPSSFSIQLDSLVGGDGMV